MTSGLTSPPALHVRASRGTSDPLSPAKTQHSARTGGGRSRSPKGISSTSSAGAAVAACASSAIVPSRIDGVELRDLSRANQELRETCLHASKHGESALLRWCCRLLANASVLQALARAALLVWASLRADGRGLFGDRIQRLAWTAASRRVAAPSPNTVSHSAIALPGSLGSKHSLSRAADAITKRFTPSGRHSAGEEGAAQDTR